jgi:hypothetical protein
LFAVKGEVFRAIVVHSRANHGANEEKIIRNDGEIKEVSDVKKIKKKLEANALNIHQQNCQKHPTTRSTTLKTITTNIELPTPIHLVSQATKTQRLQMALVNTKGAPLVMAKPSFFNKTTQIRHPYCDTPPPWAAIYARILRLHHRGATPIVK